MDAVGPVDSLIVSSRSAPNAFASTPPSHSEPEPNACYDPNPFNSRSAWSQSSKSFPSRLPWGLDNLPVPSLNRYDKRHMLRRVCGLDQPPGFEISRSTTKYARC
jgi:hypothetical protein